MSVEEGPLSQLEPLQDKLNHADEQNTLQDKNVESGVLRESSDSLNKQPFQQNRT